MGGWSETNGSAIRDLFAGVWLYRARAEMALSYAHGVCLLGTCKRVQ